MKVLPWYVSGPALAVAFLCLASAERHRRLRQPVEPGLRRVLRNLAIGATSAAVVALANAPIGDAISREVEQHRLGIVQYLRLPTFPNAALALLLMDYSYYLWHIALHRVPVLWRLHIDHH